MVQHHRTAYSLRLAAGPTVTLLATLLLFSVIAAAQMTPLVFSQTPAQGVSRGRPGGADASELDRARILSQAGQEQAAEVLVRQYLSAVPNSGQAHALLGLVKYREGHPDQSLDEYSAAAKLSAMSADDLRIVALDYIDLRDLPHAEQWLKESIRRNGKDWRTWRYLGGVEYSEEHAADAAAAFQQCLALDPENALAEDGLARSHEAMGQSAAAEAEYRKAVELDKAPDQSELPFLHYGAYLRKVGRLPDATTELTKAISLSPQDWEPHSELGQTKRDAGDLQSAASEMEEAIRLAPDRPRLRMILAQIYKREGYPDKAEAEIRIYTQTVKKADSNREDLDR